MQLLSFHGFTDQDAHHAKSDPATVEANNQQITGDYDISDATDSQSNSYCVVLTYLLTYSCRTPIIIGTQAYELKAVPPKQEQNNLSDTQLVGMYILCP